MAAGDIRLATAVELERLGHLREAAVVYQALTEAHAGGARPFQRLAIIYRRFHKPEQELAVLDDAIVRVPAEQRAWFKLRRQSLLARG
jgi:hypothetical protein